MKPRDRPPLAPSLARRVARTTLLNHHRLLTINILSMLTNKELPPDARALATDIYKSLTPLAAAIRSIK